ncbi:MAG TPA: hypothetical protein DDZ66_05735, partial [Firmicutes bacterium]|nr:hypothetical protein [Bacillota bacterium]
LQLDGDALFLQAMDDYCSRLSDVDYQGVASATAFLQSFGGEVPDVILLDIDLQPKGGLAVLERIRVRFSSDEVKVIVLATEAASEQALSHTVRLGADYFIQRPVDLVVLEKRIRQLVKYPEPGPSGELTRRQVQEICTRYFDRMGVPPHYKGYRYLMEGIWLASLHLSWLSSVTQTLYPAIGQHFEVNGSQVERAMRYALDVTWEKGNVEQLYNFFPYVSENKGKPTNSAFIAKMVDLVSLEASRGG